MSYNTAFLLRALPMVRHLPDSEHSLIVNAGMLAEMR